MKPPLTFEQMVEAMEKQVGKLSTRELEIIEGAWHAAERVAQSQPREPHLCFPPVAGKDPAGKIGAVWFCPLCSLMWRVLIASSDGLAHWYPTNRADVSSRPDARFGP